jgi:hypothetical protein
VNATVVIWAVFLKAVHFKPIMRPVRRDNLKKPVSEGVWVGRSDGVMVRGEEEPV